MQNYPVGKELKFHERSKITEQTEICNKNSCFQFQEP